jgi:hypothetical protein
LRGALGGWLENLSQEDGFSGHPSLDAVIAAIADREIGGG